MGAQDRGLLWVAGWIASLTLTAFGCQDDRLCNTNEDCEGAQICDLETTRCVAEPDVSTADSTVDPDAAPDATPDATPDAAPDAAADAVVDSGASGCADVEVPCDAAHGVCTDADLCGCEIGWSLALDGHTCRSAWVHVPGGSFQMGSNVGDANERPVHEVTVPGFELWRTEVTVAEYRACFEAGACSIPDFGDHDCNWAQVGRDQHPINCVSWHQAAAFAAWVGGRQPTEAEWEYAARSAGEAHVYPWGDAPADCDRAVMNGHDGSPGCGAGLTGPVCSKPSGDSAQGICDLAGNVWEWTADWYAGYDETPRDGSAHIVAGTHRVVRGGSWRGDGDVAQLLRAAHRRWLGPSNRGSNLGFRPARTVLVDECAIDTDGCDWRHGGCVDTPESYVCTCNPGWTLDLDAHTCRLESMADGPVGIEWLGVEGGAYEMGSDDDLDNERPVHQVTVSSFYLGRTEVTVAQYRACFDAGACTSAGEAEGCNWGEAGRGEHPINCVDWDQAQAFAAWAGARLPTEAEWEYAARGGGEHRTYPWGDEAASCDRAVMNVDDLGCGLDQTWAVCSKPDGHSQHGACDLAGNVWEWVEDWYVADFEDTPLDGSAYADSTSGFRVDRGGSWRDSADNLRTTRRDRSTPGERTISLGFRLVRAGP